MLNIDNIINKAKMILTSFIYLSPHQCNHPCIIS